MLKKIVSNTGDMYYIRGLNTKKGTGWIWDKANNTITEVPLDKIMFPKSPSMNKNGGVLKM
mgnify:CR=1 FL=1